MDGTILILAPKLREAMRKAGELVLFELPDQALVEIPIEMQAIVGRFLDFDRSLDQFWSDYARVTGLAEPFVRAARYSCDDFLLELRKAKLVKPELQVACYGSLQDEKDRSRLSEKLLALELRSKISRIDVKDWRGYLAEELQSSESSFKNAYDNFVGLLRAGLKTAILWSASAGPIVNFLRQNSCPFRVRYVMTYLKPPLTVLLAVARIRGLNNIMDHEIEIAVRMHLQYLDYVVSSENLDAAHKRWQETIQTTGKHKVLSTQSPRRSIPQ